MRVVSLVCLQEGQGNPKLNMDFNLQDAGDLTRSQLYQHKCITKAASGHCHSPVPDVLYRWPVRAPEMPLYISSTVRMQHISLNASVYVLDKCLIRIRGPWLFTFVGIIENLLGLQHLVD